MLALCSKYSMWFFISISPLPVPSCSLLDSLTHSLLLISTDMIHSSLLFMTEPLWARVLSSGFERTSRAVSALTVWRILLVFYAVYAHTRARTHTHSVWEVEMSSGWITQHKWKACDHELQRERRPDSWKGYRDSCVIQILQWRRLQERRMWCVN